MLLDCSAMDDVTPAEHLALINAIATREGNAQQIALQYNKPIPWLRQFVKDNREELERVRELWERQSEEEQASFDVSPAQLTDLWITHKAARLARYQRIAELMFDELLANPGDSTMLREFRSYLAAVANELGQLLHRGSGEAGMGDTVSYDIQGVDLDNLR